MGGGPTLDRARQVFIAPQADVAVCGWSTRLALLVGSIYIHVRECKYVWGVLQSDGEGIERGVLGD